jgi:Domain of unknown function (DUF4296)
MKWQIACMLALVLVVSCSDKNKVPEGIIPVARMEVIVWQLMQVDEYVNTLLVKDSSKKSSTERALRYQQVFELNKTTREVFQQSYRYYMAHPEITKLVFDSVIARAGRQRTELYKTRPDSGLKPAADTTVKHLRPVSPSPQKK